MIFLYAAFLLLACVALAAHIAARGRARATGLPEGELVYGDTGFAVGKIAPARLNAEGERQERPLVSRRHGLTGRPDYLVRTRDGIIPVEAKSARRPAGGRPYDSHLMQLAAYCLLVEDALGARVPYGVVRYADAEVRVEYTDELRETLLETLAEIRDAREAEDVHRSHDEPRRCASCGYRDVCDESLA
ncbi:MAG TPA: CRISPR-associated protein Cas4 [Pyrinomonadaceae bacterium]|jgi:CRISPR-associated exonuclease Cas4|nr:CRISPR-associated protein Cas4 [Pyrinomonadaceae bacterium]